MRFFKIASFLSIFLVLAMAPFFVCRQERSTAPSISETVVTDKNIEAPETIEAVQYESPESEELETEELKVEEPEFEEQEPGFCNEDYKRTIIAIDEVELADGFYASASLDETVCLVPSLEPYETDISIEDMIAELERIYAEIENAKFSDSVNDEHVEEIQNGDELVSETITPIAEEPEEITVKSEPAETETDETTAAETTVSAETPETTSKVAETTPAEQTTEPETTAPETTVPVTTVPETAVPETTAPDEPEPVVSENVTLKKYETSFARDSEEVKVLAQCLKGEAGAAHSDMQKAAVIWCVLNRVDSEDRYYPDDIISVVTQPNQFTGYHDGQPVCDDLVDIVMDVLGRWEAEHRGESNVGRVLPKDYLFFAGKTSTNYFRKTYRITEDTVYWDWSLPNPYNS